MKEIMMWDQGKVEVIEAEKPVVKEGEALLKLLYGGICGSDLSSYRGTMKYITYPRVPGHEFSAEIVEIGENKEGFKKGDIITANPYFVCGHCYSCQQGLINCCMSSKTMGIQREGAFSEYITLPVSRLFHGKGLSAKTLALVEPFCIGYHGVKRANIKKGEKVLVVGAGTIGIMAALSALSKGAIVTISDVAKDKLEYAKKFGIQHTILNSSPEAFTEGVKKYSEGNGYDVTIEAVGLPQTSLSCVESAAFGGRMIQLGVGKKPAEFLFTSIQQKELTILGSRNARPEDFEEAIDMLSEKVISIDDVVTNLYDLDDAAKAFEDFNQNAGSMLKVMIKF
jgi:2-desacetyl-2-hydroxyethyl bacteriochlorophyllide A dehydrogenase